MNLVINSKCNNHCSYCFEEEMTHRDQVMTLEEFIKILQYRNKSVDYEDIIRILGGEPTLNENFIEYIEEAKKYTTEKNILIITNLLGLEKNIEYISKQKNIQLLINGTYDDNNEELFFEHMKKINFFRNVTLSVTLMPNHNINLKYINKIKKILDNYPIKFFRLGLMQPKPSKPLYEIYNYDIEINMILELLNTTKVVKINFDCPINYCEISTNTLQNLTHNKRFIIENLSFGGCFPRTDINPDMSTQYCYSSKNDFHINNIFDFNNYHEAIEYLIEKATKYKIKNKKCRSCKLFKEGKCFPCHAFDQALLRGEKVLKEKKKKEFKEKLFGHKKEAKH